MERINETTVENCPFRSLNRCKINNEPCVARSGDILFPAKCPLPITVTKFKENSNVIYKQE